MATLTHFDSDGNAVMVDVSAKDETERVATAAGSVIMQPETVQLIAAGGVKKGDVLRLDHDRAREAGEWAVRQLVRAAREASRA